MSDIKMSEMFPEAFQVDHNKSFEVQDATWYSYGEKYESDGDQDSAIEHAVLNHDRLQQENAELREENKRIRNVKSQSESCCVDVFRDFSESEIQSMPPSIVGVWEKGRHIVSKND
ncbi:coil containing protein [Vibrio phage 1.191.O._10N.286.52.B4]|nr:coil containing protein [Vibrio phage 1.191.O._10N.286.52.B4]